MTSRPHPGIKVCQWNQFLDVFFQVSSAHNRKLPLHTFKPEASTMSQKSGSNGSLGNSSNPRPGQSPFPPSNALVRQTTQGSQRSKGTQQSQSYSSSYSNNFNRNTARYSTGRTEESSRYSQEFIDPPERSQSPPLRRKQGEDDIRKNWEESIYGLYGDLKTPREPPPLPQPRPQQEQPRRRSQEPEPEEDEGNNSFDEEVPRRTNPQSERQRSRYSRPRQSSRPERPEPRRRASRQDRQQNEQQGEQNDDTSYRRVHVNIDIGGGGEGRTWSWSTDGRGGPNVNFGTPFADTGFPFGGRNNNGSRLPVNIPFGGGLPINLPFGL
ncbi:hypothetical protein CGRA01v4_09611 [Colletotrichum graminicola]|nr:hypothetical protein CGRA01v4_09611 [Colletotrichum graminicola]